MQTNITTEEGLFFFFAMTIVFLVTAFLVTKDDNINNAKAKKAKARKSFLTFL